MDMAQQSSLKFKFPAHIISLVVRTTGCRLGRDKLVVIGAAFVKVPNPRVQVQILEKKTFQFEVDADEPLDANFMSAEELKQLQGEAKPTAQSGSPGCGVRQRVHASRSRQLHRSPKSGLYVNTCLT